MVGNITRLMGILGNDLELTPEKIQHDFMEASRGKGDIKTNGQYQVVMRGKEQKSLITDGYRSSSKMVEQACKKSFEKIISVFDECVADDDIEIEFLTQHVVTYQSRP